MDEKWKSRSSYKPEFFHKQFRELITEKKQFLSVLSLNSIEQAYDMDVHILKELIKLESNPENHLELAFTWNRDDIARDYIFSQPQQFTSAVILFAFIYEKNSQ